MKVDKDYCMSAFLMYRSLLEENITFKDGIIPRLEHGNFLRIPVCNSKDLFSALKNCIENATMDGEAALALSGGIDSAILAKMMPPKSIAYTFRCVVPGKQVIDETSAAAAYAKECDLEHRVIDIYWEDFEDMAPILMRKKGAPIHSIEVQIYKAALRAKQDGFSKFIFGENADAIYGGMDGLLAKDWCFGEFVERYSYILPYKVLRDPVLILEPFKNHEKDGHIDGHSFVTDYYRRESLGTYENACNTAAINFVGPFSETYLSEPIDYSRIRKGESKYIIRELFKHLYPGWEIPPKVPMPRPMNEWMQSWSGPTRKEFYPGCAHEMTGDQKWMLYSLEQFLNIMKV